jgi:5-methyltetrahydrofolate--homocysteine methyltransferase
VKAAREKGIRLVGLSALMTTTLPAMAETVRQLKELPDPPQVMVGGAVVTEDYAKAIGADFYARDVREAVKVTARVFGGQ